ncbi:MAG: cytochrome c-type biogenesis protein CcmH [Bdellovibrionota bacterium]
MKKTIRVLISKTFALILLGHIGWFGHEGLFASSLGFEGMSEEQIELFQRVGNNLRCPTCTGLSVMQSEADFAVKIREAARDQVLQGKSEAEIMTFFIERYGLWILRKPPAEGFHVMAWGVPIAFALLGALFLWFFVWRKPKQVDLGGIRTTQDIMLEMENQLAQMRK